MYMMAEKAALFGDHEAVQHIMKAEHPAEMQRLGRKVKGFDETVWACERYNIVLNGTLEKYRQNEDLRKLLLATGDLVFVEASPTDKVWGIGLRASDPDSGDKNLWRGLNLLGKANTEARDIIRQSGPELT
jgi:hypothetical protein